MTAVATATRRAERFFADATADYGYEEGGIMTIPMRQCELARRRQIAASTIGAHLRAMGTRVLQRYPEIIVARTTDTSRPLSPAVDATTATVTGATDDLVGALTELTRV